MATPTNLILLPGAKVLVYFALVTSACKDDRFRYIRKMLQVFTYGCPAVILDVWQVIYHSQTLIPCSKMRRCQRHMTHLLSSGQFGADCMQHEGFSIGLPSTQHKLPSKAVYRKLPVKYNIFCLKGDAVVLTEIFQAWKKTTASG